MTGAVGSKTSLRALENLNGQPEDADFDCKEWPQRTDAARGTIAKAACDFADGTGGAIIIGLKASGREAETRRGESAVYEASRKASNEGLRHKQ